MNEIAAIIPCENDLLVGIVHKPHTAGKTGVVIVVAGGPQYRVGAHRQFVTLARMLANMGIPTLRFDHRGTGDSTGKYRGFLDMNADIKNAVNKLIEEVPDLEHIVLWGECESASAIAFYAHLDPRIKGIFLVNPWIRTEEGQAKTYLKHYYMTRLLEREFWTKVFSGKFPVFSSLKSFYHMIKLAKNKGNSSNNKETINDELTNLPLPKRLKKSCELYKGKIFILTSGRKDYIAQEFKDYMDASTTWQTIIHREDTIVCEMADADHTFTREIWRTQLFDYTGNWVKEKF